MHKLNRFQRWALLTTLATYILILLGGLVRASDAGLGCPDWPTCFGRPYPPLTMAEFRQREIPADFDQSNFRVSLAWIEYINRLSGAIIGILVLASSYYAWRDHRGNPRIFYPTLGALATVLLNGWWGSQVIESRLNQLVITVHLLLAWMQVSLLLLATVSAFYPEGGLPPGQLPPGRQTLARLALIVLALAYIQGVLGANVRGRLETIEDEQGPTLARAEWIGEVGLLDYVHRSFSWLVLGGIFGLAYYAHKRVEYNEPLRYGTQATALLVMVQVAAGIGLAYAGLPPALQAIHLILGSLLLGAITGLYLLATRLPIQASLPIRLAEKPVGLQASLN
jgi:cytochrome c oxidase assembly protein subunit 15